MHMFTNQCHGLVEAYGYNFRELYESYEEVDTINFKYALKSFDLKTYNHKLKPVRDICFIRITSIIG